MGLQRQRMRRHWRHSGLFKVKCRYGRHWGLRQLLPSVPRLGAEAVSSLDSTANLVLLLQRGRRWESRGIKTQLPRSSITPLIGCLLSIKVITTRRAVRVSERTAAFMCRISGFLSSFSSLSLSGLLFIFTHFIFYYLILLSCFPPFFLSSSFSGNTL